MNFSPEFERYWLTIRDRFVIQELNKIYPMKCFAWDVWQESIKQSPVKIRTETIYRDKDEEWVLSGGV
jgi:hypothetical protein